MTRGNPGDLQPFDPKIDRTFHRLVRHSVHFGHSVHFEHFVCPAKEIMLCVNFILVRGFLFLKFMFIRLVISI